MTGVNKLSLPDGKMIKLNKNRGKKKIVSQSLIIFFLAVILFLTMFPLFITIISSFKNSEDLGAQPIWSFPVSGWMAENYVKAFNAISMPLLTTLIIDLISTLVVILMSCFIAFIFTRYKFKGRKLLFFLFILPMLVPGVVLLSPTYIVTERLGLVGNWGGLILPYIAGNQIATVFMFKVFMSQQPSAIYEAAQIDGSNMVNTFFNICIPLTFPIMMIQGISIFAAIYNDYLWPQLMYNGTKLKDGMLIPYLTEISNSEGIGGSGVQYALYLVSGIPLIFTTILSIKFFVSGDFASGMKL